MATVKRGQEMVSAAYVRSDLCILLYRVGKIKYDLCPWCICNDDNVNGEGRMVEKRILDYIINAVEERMKNDGLIG
jgi:hypothetical protein